MSRVQKNTKGTLIENEKWIRLAICINDHVKKALVEIVHNTINHKDIKPLPSDPSDLYNFMVNKKNKLKQLREDERHLLLPTDEKVFSDKLDVSMLRFLIRTFSGILNKDRNWNEPRDEDHSIAAAVFRAAKIRNEVLHHGDPESIEDEEFETKWSKIEKILADLQYKGDISDVKYGAVDTSSVEHLHSNMSKDFENILLNYKERCKYKNKDGIKMYIKREFKDESTNNIITDLDQLLSNHDSVMVSGEAGLGKTISAKHLRNLWASGDILIGKMLIYIDSKKVNKDMYKPSHAAPVCVSELRSVFKSRTEGYLESFGCVKKSIENLVIVIDGVDELHIEENKLNRKFLNELQEKINENEEISAMETIMGIYFGTFFPGSKIIVFGRKNEIDRLKDIKKDQLEQSYLFNKENRAILELQPLDEDGIKELISRANCSKTCCNCEQCSNTYSLVKGVEFRNVPSHLMALIKISNDISRTKIGRITKTKIFIITIFNLLKSHTSIDILNDAKTFKKVLAFDGAQEFRKCIQSIAEISFFSLLVGNVTIEVEECNEDGVEYFKYEQIYDGENICIKIKREILGQLDFFYVRDLIYRVILEPYHLTTMEFLASCYIYGHRDKWDLLLRLNGDRQKIILPYIAGLHSNESFTKDFVSSLLLKDSSEYDIENYLDWLFTIEDVEKDLVVGTWFGMKENDQLFPPFDLLHAINEEVDVFNNISKRLKEVKTLFCYCNENFEWYEMEYFRHSFLTNNKEEYNMKSFMTEFKKYRIIIIGEVKITIIEQFNLLSEMFQNERLTFKIYNLELNLVMPHSTKIAKPMKFGSLYIRKGCDSHTLDLLLDASSISTTTTSSNISPIMKYNDFDIEDVTKLNDQQIEKLFEIGLSGVWDSILLRNTFFTGRHIEILKRVETRYTDKLISIKLGRIEFNKMFELLSNFCNRGVGLYDIIGNVTDKELIEFQKYITPGYSNNIYNYKIISLYLPFIRKENCSQKYEHTMYFNFNKVNFEEVSPKNFANTFSLIPSLECLDILIPTSHWLCLSQIEDCRINEMRIWDPKLENFEHFLNIETKIIQFICNSKDDLKQLLDHIVNNPIIQSDKGINIFVVKYDITDYDYYEEIPLFDVKTIVEYRSNHCAYDLLIEKFHVPYHEGRRQDHWCCEISLPSRRNSNEVYDTLDEVDGNPSEKYNSLSWLLLGLGLVLGLGLLLKNRSVR